MRTDEARALPFVSSPLSSRQPQLVLRQHLVLLDDRCAAHVLKGIGIVSSSDTGRHEAAAETNRKLSRSSCAGSTWMSHVAARIVPTTLFANRVFLTTKIHLTQIVEQPMKSTRVVRSRVIRPVLAGIQLCMQLLRASGPFYATCGSQPGPSYGHNTYM